MAGKSTISITFKLDGDGKGFQDLAKDADGLKKVMTSAIVEAEKLNKSVINWSQSVQAIGAVSNAISQINGALQSVTGESRSFKTAMKEANTLADKDGAGFGRMTGQVAELSKRIPVLRDVLARGLYTTISSSVPEDNWLSFLEQSAKSSVGGLAELNSVIGVTATIIKNYGLAWEDAEKIQDKIQLTVKRGVTTFQEMAEGLPTVAANAATLGVTIDELTAAFATLTGVSGNTAEVSTQLSGVFMSLVKPSSEAADMAERMGIQFNAAAIKAAGGLQPFLASLDAAVKKYAAASGELEQAVYGKLFGNVRALRAIIPLNGELADKFAENVAAMENSAGTIDKAFAEMSSTGSAVTQMLKNQYGAITDVIAGLAGASMPYLNFISNLGITTMSVISLVKTYKALNVAQALTITKNKALNASMLLVGVSTKRTAAVTRIFSAAMQTGAYKATALKLAINGLKIATGVGVAFFALTEIIEHFSKQSDEAAGKADEFSEATDAYKSAATNAKTEIEGEAKKLRELIAAKKDTTEAVEHLNRTYGNTFGQYKTASDWYDVLTRKSSLYAQQIGYEAQARVLATKIAEKQIALEMNAEKQRELERNGKATKSYKYLTKDAYGKPMIGTGRVDTKPMKEAKREAEALNIEITGLQNQLGVSQVKLDEIAKKISETGGSISTTTEQLSVNAMTWTQVNDAIAKVESQLKNTTDGKKIAELKAYNEQLKERKKLLDARLGFSTPKVEKPKETNTVGDGIIEQLEAKIADARKRLAAATSEAAIEAINKEIEVYQSELSRYEALGKAVKESVKKGADDNTPIWKVDAATLKDIYGNIDILEDKLQTASMAEAAVINQQIKNWNDKAEAIRKAGFAIDEVQKKQEKINFRTFTTAWGSVRGLESGIQGITDALEGNGSAWQKVTAIVDGFIAIYEGISTVVGIINLLNTATTAAAAAKTAEGAATSAVASAQTVQTATSEANALAQIPVIAANKAATASYTQLAASMYMAAHAYIPFAGFGIASGFATSAAALVQSIGVMPFAEGGVIYGPTLGLVGEYAGASNNPEIVAPLDKLRGMLQPANEFPGGKVRFVIDGRTLVGVLERESNVRKRS